MECNVRGQGQATRQKLADVLAEDLKRKIILDALKPNDLLPNERVLIDTYGCAKATIREVTIDPTCRALRNFLHFQRVDGGQGYQLRHMIEVETVMSAVGHLDEPGFARLRDNIAQCRLIHDEEQSQRRRRGLELEFHDILAEYCPNPLLRFMSQFLNDFLRDLIVLKEADKAARRIFDQANIDFHVALV